MICSDLIIDKTRWLDLKEIWETYCIPNGLKRIICVGDNSIGKSYSAEQWVIRDYLMRGKHAVWIRNTEKETISCISGWKSALAVAGLDNEYQVCKTGVWRMGGDMKDYKKNLMIAFVYLSSPDTSVPQGIQARIIVLDEIIPGNEKNKFTMKEPIAVIKKIFARVVRPLGAEELVPMVFISNPHSLECDIINGLGLDFNYELLYNGQDQLEILGDNLFMVFPKQFQIKENQGCYDYWSDINQPCENYTFLPEGMKRIFTFKPERFSEFLYNFTYENASNEFSIWKDPDSDDVYVQRINKEYIDDINFCVRELDKNYHNVLIPADKVYDCFIDLEQAKLNCDGVYYDTLFTKDITNKLIVRCSMYDFIINKLKRQ